MKVFQIILISLAAIILAGCKGDTNLPDPSTRHKGISAEDQKAKKGE
jgi:hypothetical protein